MVLDERMYVIMYTSVRGTMCGTVWCTFALALYCHVQDGSLCDSNIYCTMYVQLGLTLAYDIIVDNNVCMVCIVTLVFY